ncbi:hypothetical protein L7F22_036824 [Adiantum nelumboides]|nr:hypothetical protein [Adiantum nelumboides]
MRWENFLSHFNFHIAHIAGKHNQVADALLRRPKVNAVSIATHNDLSSMIDEYAIDPDFKDVISAIALGKKEEPFTLEDGYLLHGNRLCITHSLREKVMYESHAPPYAGHRGIQSTLRAIETYFYWPTMKRDIHDYVSKCVVCQKTKFDRGKQPGLLQPLPILDSPWESISMDFIFGLPKSIHGNTGIWTIVDRFSKQAHFIPVKKTIKAHQMGTLFISQIFKYRGLPSSIVPDRDHRMTSNFWKGLFENLGTGLNFSSAYHPQTDGQNEIANLTILDLLKSYVTEVDQRSQWEKYLPLVEYAYNNTVHTSTGKAPFEVIEGRSKSPLLLKPLSLVLIPVLTLVGYEEDLDIISAVEFDKSGEHLATGDRGGRLVLFERTDGKDGRFRKELERTDTSVLKHPEYRYKTEFQSHEPEFDYLKSLEIEEKINKIRWCESANRALFLLSTNDKTIKLWKVLERKVKKVSEMNVDSSVHLSNGDSLGQPQTLRLAGSMANGSMSNMVGSSSDSTFCLSPDGMSSLHLPMVVCSNEVTHIARCRRIYTHAHDYHINSISTNSDAETFISADDLRINLWNLEISDQSFNIVDIKPANMEDLTEVITSAEFHPTHCNILAYSSSKGTIRLVDMRQSALCDRHTKLFEEQEVPRSFFTEIIASISDLKFARDGRYMVSRDYMTVKLWDVNMGSAPVATVKVHEYLRPKLCDLYENDSIFDKFECCLSGDGSRAATGSYRYIKNLFGMRPMRTPSVETMCPRLGGLFGGLELAQDLCRDLRVFGTGVGSEEATTLEASRTPNRRPVQSMPSNAGRSVINFARHAGGRGNEMDSNSGYSFSAKLLHLTWHPSANLIACAASNSLYMYYA